MSYEAEISRANPTCFLFLVDQSGSMAEAVGRRSGQDQGGGRRGRHQPSAADAGAPLFQRRLHPRPLLHRGGRLRRPARRPRRGQPGLPR